jgi:hypothetical protein
VKVSNFGPSFTVEIPEKQRYCLDEANPNDYGPICQGMWCYFDEMSSYLVD